jgi:hypothetical protein
MMIVSQSGLLLGWSCACDDPRNGHELKSRERFNIKISRTELPAACVLLRMLMIRMYAAGHLLVSVCQIGPRMRFDGERSWFI